MTDGVALIPAEGVGRATIDDVLCGEWGFRRRDPQAIVRDYYDTPDGRLFSAGLVVEHESIGANRWLRVRRRGEARALAQAAVATVAGSPSAGWAARVGELLEVPAAGRALVRLVGTSATLTRYEAGAGCAHPAVAVAVVEAVAWDAAHPERGRHRLEPVIHLRPVHGDATAVAGAADALVARLRGRAAPEPLERAAAATGVPLGVARRWSAPALDASARASVSAQRLLARLADLLEANAPGVREAIDDEYLHDFRVNLRRARAVLSVADGVLDADEVRHLAQDLRDLMALTSSVRDLEVIAAAWRGDELLEVLRPVLEAEEGVARAALIDALDEQRLATLVQRMRTVAPAAGPSAAVPTVRWAAAVLPAQLRRVHRRARPVRERRAGAGSDAVSLDDQALHATRRALKRLRYLLDAFDALDQDHRRRPLRRRLADLQDDLGTVQDAVVAVATIDRVTGSLPGLTPARRAELAARRERQVQEGLAAARRSGRGLERLYRRRRRDAGRLGAASPSKWAGRR